MTHSRLSRYLMAAPLALLLAGWLLAACNPQKKNTAAARRYTAFITKYNIYYNGDTHYKETLDGMEDKYEDDYSHMVLMHPIEAKSDKKAPQPSGSFTRSIEKAQKAIQVRSIKKKPKKNPSRTHDPEYKAWLQRDEYNPFLHNAWMLMGRSQYYNGDFLGAASTFFYVSKHFTWLPQTVTEARLWQALCYVSLDWPYEAELIISRIKPEEIDSKELRYLYNFTCADMYVRTARYQEALPYLKVAADDASGSQKTRLRFLLGQVYARLGMNAEAYEAFRKAGSSSSATYRTKFNARIKQSEVYSGSDITSEVKALRRMTRYDRNKEYLDQIYYAIGNLYLSRGDTAQAVENYILAAEKSTRNGIDKAISQITLGTIYFEQGNYEKAQPCYAEAIPQLPETYPGYKSLKKRSDVLDELAVYSQNVNLQDSLLRLAAMPEEERLAVIDKIIEDLKKREKEEADEARRLEYEAAMNSGAGQLNDNNNREFSINSDNSWYFYNANSRNSGKTEFQRRWGSRKLEDDWRRRNKTVFDSSDFDSPDDSADGDSAADTPVAETDSVAEAEKMARAEAASDPHNREYYLSQIPSTPEEVATSHEIIQESLYNMGIILKDKLEDYPAALAEFDRLLKDYPDNTYRLDIYYNLYLMFMREQDFSRAEEYRRLILTDFPESNYGLALRDPDYIEHLKRMDSVQESLYEQAYTDYLENRNQAVHRACAEIQSTYPMSPLIPKFMFLDALAYVTEKEPDKFNQVLREMLERYPDTDVAPFASSWLKGMAQGRGLQASADGTNMRGMIWDIRLTNDSVGAPADSLSGFTIDDNAPQLLVLVYPTDAVNTNMLLYEVARHNFSSFVVKDFDLEPMNFGRLGMLVIKGFDNMRELNHYRSVMASSDGFRLPPGVRPIAISVANFDNMLKAGRSFDDYFRFLQEQQYRDAQSDIIPTTEIETLEEAEEAEALRNDADTSTDISTDISTDTDAVAVPADLPVAPEDPANTAAGASEPANASQGSAPLKQGTPPAGKDSSATPKKDNSAAQGTKNTVPVGSEGDDDPLLNP